jgi:hypothetical protein
MGLQARRGLEKTGRETHPTTRSARRGLEKTGQETHPTTRSARRKMARG